MSRHRVIFNPGARSQPWADRSKSVLVEEGGALLRMAAYIDLDCVRAVLADDPKYYRFCAYGTAAGGCKVACSGLMELYEQNGGQIWKEVGKTYRNLLFSAGEQRIAEPGRRAKRGISPERVKQVLKGDGELSIRELVHCRVRHFCDGLALGEAEFVERIFQTNRELLGKRRKEGARPLAAGDYGGLRTLRNLRRAPIEVRG